MRGRDSEDRHAGERGRGARGNEVGIKFSMTAAAWRVGHTVCLAHHRLHRDVLKFSTAFANYSLRQNLFSLDHLNRARSDYASAPTAGHIRI